VPNRKALSCLGAWAFGHDVVPDVPDSEYMVPEVKELCNRVDILATHPYANFTFAGGGRDTMDEDRAGYYYLLRDFRPEGWRDSREPSRPHDPGGILAQYPHKPLLITECGTFTHGDPGRNPDNLAAMRKLYDFAARSGRVLGCTWFVWNSGPEHAGNRIWYNEALRNGLESLGPYHTNAVVPTAGEDVTSADIFHWPVGQNADERASPSVPSDYYIALGYGDVYTLNGTPNQVHPGIDLNAITGGDSDLGAPVYCVAPGVVTFAGSAAVWGNIILVRHDRGGLWSQYAHCADVYVSKGDTVARGQIIGTIGKGESGRYSAHLHFELRSCNLDASAWPGTDAAMVDRCYINPVDVLGVGIDDNIAPMLREWADDMQVIRPNEGAALWQAMKRDGYYPISNEGDIGEYRAQLARDLASDEERVYYASIGQWSDVNFIVR